MIRLICFLTAISVAAVQAVQDPLMRRETKDAKHHALLPGDEAAPDDTASDKAASDTGETEAVPESDPLPDLTGQGFTGAETKPSRFDVAAWKQQAKHALSQDQKWMDAEMKRMKAKRQDLDQSSAQKRVPGIDAGVLPPKTGAATKPDNAKASPAGVVKAPTSSALVSLEADAEVQPVPPLNKNHLDEFRDNIMKARDHERQTEEAGLRKEARAWSKKKNMEEVEAERKKNGLPTKGSKNDDKTAKYDDQKKAQQDRQAAKEMQEAGVRPELLQSSDLLERQQPLPVPAQTTVKVSTTPHAMYDEPAPGHKGAFQPPMQPPKPPTATASALEEKTKLWSEKWITTASGLQYRDTKVGGGDKPAKGQSVFVQYTGRLQNGKEFDSSPRGQPFEFPVGTGKVIAGWDEGILSMRVGGSRQLRIPPSLAYGSSGAGGVIPPDATLDFDCKLVKLGSTKL